MDWRKLIIESLMKERELLVKARDFARATRDSAPTANESHSDTTRSEQEKMVSALDGQIWNLDTGIKQVEIIGAPYYEIDNGGVKMKLVIVPDGLGGKKVGDAMLISSATPIGKVLIGRKSGDTVDLSGRKVQILNAQ